MRSGTLIIIHLCCFAVRAQQKYTAVFRDKAREYEFSLHMQEKELDCSSGTTCEVKTISAFSKKENKVLQEIDVPGGNCNYCVNGLDTAYTLGFVAEDMNFDGYTDFRLMDFLPAYTWNVNYLYWLYNPSKKMFERDTLLEVIYGPEFDASSKKIRKYWKEDDGMGTETYQWINGKIVMTETETTRKEQINGKARAVTRREKLVNGKWIKIN